MESLSARPIPAAHRSQYLTSASTASCCKCVLRLPSLPSSHREEHGRDAKRSAGSRWTLVPTTASIAHKEGFESELGVQHPNRRPRRLQGDFQTLLKATPPQAAGRCQPAGGSLCDLGTEEEEEGRSMSKMPGGCRAIALADVASNGSPHKPRGVASAAAGLVVSAAVWGALTSSAGAANEMLPPGASQNLPTEQAEKTARGAMGEGMTSAVDSMMSAMEAMTSADEAPTPVGLLPSGNESVGSLADAFGLRVAEEPSNALSLPTWVIHVASVAEWVTAMALVWQYGGRKGREAWRGLAWGMIPSLMGAMCACTWHFFYNAPELEAIVALQSFMTLVGNCTLWIAAYRIYKQSQAKELGAK